MNAPSSGQSSQLILRQIAKVPHVQAARLLTDQHEYLGYRKFLFIVLGSALFVGSVISQVPKRQSAEGSQMSMASPDGLKWVIRPGNEMAVVYGDPSKAGEMYAVRFRFAQTGSRYRPTGILKLSTQLSCKALFCWDGHQVGGSTV